MLCKPEQKKIPLAKKPVPQTPVRQKPAFVDDEARRLNNLGVECSKIGRQETAAEYLEQGVILFPENQILRNNLVKVLYFEAVATSMFRRDIYYKRALDSLEKRQNTKSQVELPTI